MKKIVLKYKKELFICSIICLVLIPLAIHVVFKIRAPIAFLGAVWTAGDVLAFYGVILGAIATIIGVYISINAAHENYREDMINRSLPFMVVQGLAVKKGDDNCIASSDRECTGSSIAFDEYDEYNIEKLYYVIKKGKVSITDKLTSEQKKNIITGGRRSTEVVPGVTISQYLKTIYTPLQIENVGNGVAVTFSVGINNSSLPAEKRVFSLARSLKVRQSFYVALYSDNSDDDNIGTYDICISYYDILGHGYEQNFTYEITKDSVGTVTAKLQMKETQKRIES